MTDELPIACGNILWSRAREKWHLTSEEYGQMVAYLEGPRRSMDYDALPDVVQAAVNEIE